MTTPVVTAQPSSLLSTIGQLQPSLTAQPTPSPSLSATALPQPPTTPVIDVRPMHFANFLSFDNGSYNMSWMFNSSMDTLHFLVEVRTTGWIGFGVATQAPNNMTGYDVAVGGVLNGTGYLKVTRLSAICIIWLFLWDTQVAWGFADLQCDHGNEIRHRRVPFLELKSQLFINLIFQWN